jgi:hypothetical protein
MQFSLTIHHQMTNAFYPALTERSSADKFWTSHVIELLSLRNSFFQLVYMVEVEIVRDVGVPCNSFDAAKTGGVTANSVLVLHVTSSLWQRNGAGAFRTFHEYCKLEYGRHWIT